MCEVIVYRFILLSVLLVISGSALARETKLEKAKNKEAFWGVMSDMAMVRLRCASSGTKACEPDAIIWLTHAKLHFQQIDQRFPNHDQLNAILERMTASLRVQGNAPLVRREVWQFEEALLSQLDLVSMPVEALSFERGKQLFQTHCADCHGGDGNGSGLLTSKLRRVPASLREQFRVEELSPLSVYAAMIHGIEDSEMGGMLDVLAQDEMWNVAFYAATLTTPVADMTSCQGVTPEIDLKTLMRSSNAELQKSYQIQGACSDSMAYLRRVVSYDPNTRREAVDKLAPQGSKSMRGLVVMGLSVLAVSVGFIWILRARGRLE